jgi:hypothetical protein
MRHAIFAIALLTCAAGGCARMSPSAAPRNLVLNGDFESGMDGWSYVSEGNAAGSAELVSDMPLNSASPHVLKLVASALGQRCGIANSGGARGINVSSGQWYEATFYARAEPPGRGIGLVFSLETPDGKKVCGRTTLPEIGRGGEIGTPVEGSDRWREYRVSIHAYASDPHCRLVISPIEPATLFFDGITLAPRSAGATGRGNP